MINVDELFEKRYGGKTARQYFEENEYFTPIEMVNFAKHCVEQSHIQVVMQAEGSDVEVDWDKNVKPKPTAEYKLKVISVQNSEGATVGQRSVDTGVSAGCCDHVEWVVRLGILQCANCGNPH